MKKVAILIRTLDTGGIERSLVNLLNYCAKIDYKVDLFLFDKKGTFINQIPENININLVPGNHSLITYSQKEARKKGLLFKLKRTISALFVRVFTTKMFIKRMLKKIPNYDDYDCAISYQITATNKALYYGPTEVVINKFTNAKKIAFVHNDFVSAKLNSKYVFNLIDKLDKVVFVSKSCMDNFLNTYPEYKDKVDYSYNLSQDKDEIIKLSKEDVKENTFDKNAINLITVARLGEEKAHLRTLKILKSLHDDYSFVYHIVGDGPERKSIEEFIKNNNMQDYVVLYGNQANPYKYVAKSDLFLLLSYHEAAPMVIGESYCLDVPVLSTNTVSANEMINDDNFICENNEIAIKEKLEKLLKVFKNKKFKTKIIENKEKFERLIKIIEE